MSEQKINVIVKDGIGDVRIKHGAEILELQDESSVTFNTNRVTEVISFIKNELDCPTDKDGNPDCRVFYSDNGIVVLSGESYNSEPDVVCKLEPSIQLNRLLGSMDQKMNPEQAHNFLRAMIPSMEQEGLALCAQLRDLKINKAMSYEHQKKQNGDYIYSVKMQNSEGSWAPPKIVNFRVPLFRYHYNLVTIPVNFVVDLVQDGDGKYLAKLTFDCPTITEILDEARKKAIEIMIQDVPGNKYWGTARVNQATNEFKYLGNVFDKGLVPIPSA